MTVTTETQYTVRFIGSYFSLLTTVMAENEEQAREQLEQKGWSQHLNASGDLEIFDLEEVK